MGAPFSPAAADLRLSGTQTKLPFLKEDPSCAGGGELFRGATWKRVGWRGDAGGGAFRGASEFPLPAAKSQGVGGGERPTADQIKTLRWGASRRRRRGRGGGISFVNVTCQEGRKNVNDFRVGGKTSRPRTLTEAHRTGGRGGTGLMGCGHWSQPPPSKSAR